MPDFPVDSRQLALGQETLDRRADLRRAGWAEVPEARRLVLVSGQGEVAVDRRPDGTATLATTDPSRPGVVPAGAGPADLLLGLDQDGQALIGRVVDPADTPVAPDVAWASLRSVGMSLSAQERGVVAELLALANWHRSHRRCPRCGTRTEVSGLGWWRTCPQDGSEHYPRTDPAIIAVLVDGQGNALLGRQAVWPAGAFSTLAGFVEPGESAESAVSREIGEEVGLVVDSVRYVASQPWPFPGSLMLGFVATVEGVRPEPTVDGTEIVEARWVSRAELPHLCEDGQVRLPGRLSIAHHLLRGWFGADIPERWCRW